MRIILISFQRYGTSLFRFYLQPELLFCSRGLLGPTTALTWLFMTPPTPVLCCHFSGLSTPRRRATTISGLSSVQSNTLELSTTTCIPTSQTLKCCLICFRLVYIVFWDYLTQPERPSTSVQLRHMLSVDRIVLLHTVQHENGIVPLTETEHWHWHR